MPGGAEPKSVESEKPTTITRITGKMPHGDGRMRRIYPIESEGKVNCSTNRPSCICLYTFSKRNRATSC